MKLLLVAFTTATAVSLAASDGSGALKPLVGRWKAMLQYVENGGRFTAAWAEALEVKQRDPKTIAFSIKPAASADPVFEVTLSYESSSDTYVLSVRNREKSVVDKLPLTASAGGGFSGEGTITDSSGKTHSIKLTIARDGEGYEWAFKDPAGREGNNTILGFSFIERTP